MTTEEYKKELNAHSQSKRIHALFEKQMKEAEIFFVAEYKFHIKRKWKFDFVLAGHKAGIFKGMDLEIFASFKKIAVEIDGGLWINGRHSRGSGQIKDNEKFNEAALLGWRVIKVTPQQVKNGEAIKLIKRLFE